MKILASTVLFKILEVSSAYYPEKNGIFAPDQNFILPSQSTVAQFNGNQNILCGPSPFMNTLNCFSTKYSNFVQSIPIPGNVSSTPVFANNSWIIGTTKGFLFRAKTKSKLDSTFRIGPEISEFWGPHSREIMENFVPKTIYRDSASTKPTEPQKPEIPKSYVWLLPSSSPIIGTPIVKNEMVYALSASQLLQAIDFATGKLIWTFKIAPESTFYLKNNSLRVTEDYVLIGTDREKLLVIDAKSGHQIKEISISHNLDHEDRFRDIIAAPLLLPHNQVIVSNVMSVTQKISLDSSAVIWSYPDGSITTPLLLNDTTVIITTASGKIASLNEHTGAVNWVNDLDMNSPLVDATFTNDKKTLLVATKRGALIAIDSETGKILAKNRPIGSVIGSFFQMPQHNNVSCLSFSTGSFRCFKVKI